MLAVESGEAGGQSQSHSRKPGRTEAWSRCPPASATLPLSAVPDAECCYDFKRQE
jgi:hypothetical protein